MPPVTGSNTGAAPLRFGVLGAANINGGGTLPLRLSSAPSLFRFVFQLRTLPACSASTAPSSSALTPPRARSHHRAVLHEPGRRPHHGARRARPRPRRGARRRAQARGRRDLRRLPRAARRRRRRRDLRALAQWPALRVDDEGTRRGLPRALREALRLVRRLSVPAVRRCAH